MVKFKKDSLLEMFGDTFVVKEEPSQENGNYYKINPVVVDGENHINFSKDLLESGIAKEKK